MVNKETMATIPSPKPRNVTDETHSAGANTLHLTTRPTRSVAPRGRADCPQSGAVLVTSLSTKNQPLANPKSSPRLSTETPRQHGPFSRLTSQVFRPLLSSLFPRADGCSGHQGEGEEQRLHLR